MTWETGSETETFIDINQFNCTRSGHHCFHSSRIMMVLEKVFICSELFCCLKGIKQFLFVVKGTG